MDQVVTESTQMSEDCGVQIEKTIRSMQILSVIFCLLALLCLLSKPDVLRC